LGRIIAHPAFCWFAGTGTVIAWHVPALFQVGMSSETWHAVEHASFLAAGLLFWWPVIVPWPGVARWSEWSAPLYLFLATLPCDALSAFLAFCNRVVYPHYVSPGPVYVLSPLDDQAMAGALMWTWVTFAYLGPAAVITIRILSPRQRHSNVEVA
jgi:putative membrane protein